MWRSCSKLTGIALFCIEIVDKAIDRAIQYQMICCNPVKRTIAAAGYSDGRQGGQQLAACAAAARSLHFCSCNYAEFRTAVSYHACIAIGDSPYSAAVLRRTEMLLQGATKSIGTFLLA